MTPDGVREFERHGVNVFVETGAGEGASFSWHQDGATHWDSPDWNQHSHGVNYMLLWGEPEPSGLNDGSS